MEQEELEYLRNLKEQRDEAVSKTNQMSTATNSMFSSTQDTNLIEYQLGLDDILERIEHLLRGDVLKQDKKGNIRYEQPTNRDGSVNQELQVLNEYGVQFLMNVVSSYLNRNTILSNYTEERIKEILFNLGNEITDQIYLNAEKMGLDTPERQKRYSIIVMQIVHIVESAYNRAIGGAELDSLRSARVVTQNADPLNRMDPSFINNNSNKTTSWARPSTWFR